MRTKLALIAVAVLCIPFFQCGGGDDSTAQPSSDAGNDATPANDASPMIDAAPIDSGPPIVTVNGTLNGRAGDDGPLASRDVVIVDANGVITKTTTDANGNFGATGVQTPYDIGIPYVPLDAASAAYPHYYAGISRANPIVRGADYNSVPAPSVIVYATTLSFTANVCTGCSIDYTGPDDSGSRPGSGSAQLYTATYSWNTNAVHSAPLHFYVVNAAGAYVSYLDVPSTALVSAGTTDLGTLSLATLTNGTIDVTTTIPPDYSIENTNVRPSVADGSKIPGGNFSTLTGVANFPQLAGISIEIDNGAALPDGANSNAAVTFAEAMAPATLTINLLAPPTPLLPANHATGVTDSQSLTWSAFGAPTIYQLIISSPSGSQYLIYTSSPNLSLDALTKADVPLAPGNAYTWSLFADFNVTTMDDLTNSAPMVLPGIIQGDAAAVPQTFTTQ